MKLQLLVALGILFLVNQASAQEKLDLKNQADNNAWYLGYGDAKITTGSRQGIEELPRSRSCLRQGRPGRDSN